MATSDANIGIRTRIAMLAAIATVTLFSAMGAIGYLAIFDATRQSQREELEARIDAFEARLDPEGALLTSELQLDASLVVVRDGEPIPAEPNGTLQVVRSSDIEGVRAVVGVVSTGQIDRTFATIRRGLWISVALAGLLVGAISWFVVDRALAPVRRLTGQAKAIAANPAHELLEVDASGDELAELATTLNGLLNKLRLADNERRRFVSDASHELRTPLMVISADAEYAIDHARDLDSNSAPNSDSDSDAHSDSAPQSDSDSPTAELAHSVLAQSERLTTLVDDLLTLAAIDEGQPPTDQVLTVAEVLRAADANQHASDLDPAHASRLIPDVSRSLANIVANARRHQKTTTQLTVSHLLAAAGESIVISVDDDGPGVATGDREEIFKRFYRPDSGRNRNDGGAGLGLAIARAEVAQAGGTVVVEDGVLGGARFTVTIPVATLMKRV